MASFVDKGELVGFVDKRRGRGSAASVLGTPGDYISVGTLETFLLANGYTQARLNQMTENDMIFAKRTISDSAGIK